MGAGLSVRFDNEQSNYAFERGRVARRHAAQRGRYAA